ncbi:MAG: hypothetical protein M5U12_17790 [Verrucomicrobia bacterium]|nr:hypothetical protein [Verrucomicrobiota bacterium]
MITPTDRRAFLKSAAALTALAAWPLGCATSSPTHLRASPRRKQPARVGGAFFYPPAADVIAGRAEDGWAPHQWFTWPGNQFEPEQQQARFLAKTRELAADLDLTLALEEQPLATDAAIQAFLDRVAANRPDALLLFNFWNSFSAKLKPILEAYRGPIILYHPLGANHQLPPEYFRAAPHVQYIHSIENWAALERGLRAIHARTRLSQSRLLRVSGRPDPGSRRHRTVLWHLDPRGPERSLQCPVRRSPAHTGHGPDGPVGPSRRATRAGNHARRRP